MQTQTIQQELLKLENQFWQAMKDRDVETAMNLTDYPCIIAGAQGVGSIDKRDFKLMMTAPNYSLKKFSIKPDAEVRLLSPDVAVLAYEVHEDLVVDGKPVSLDAAEASTWIKRNDRWLCAMHTEAIHGDPYGRDRLKKTKKDS